MTIPHQRQNGNSAAELPSRPGSTTNSSPRCALPGAPYTALILTDGPNRLAIRYAGGDRVASPNCSG